MLARIYVDSLRYPQRSQAERRGFESHIPLDDSHVKTAGLRTSLLAPRPSPLRRSDLAALPVAGAPLSVRDRDDFDHVVVDDEEHEIGEPPDGVKPVGNPGPPDRRCQGRLDDPHEGFIDSGDQLRAESRLTCLVPLGRCIQLFFGFWAYAKDACHRAASLARMRARTADHSGAGSARAAAACSRLRSSACHASSQPPSAGPSTLAINSDASVRRSSSESASA